MGISILFFSCSNNKTVDVNTLEQKTIKQIIVERNEKELWTRALEENLLTQPLIDELFDMENSLEGKGPVGLLAESTICKLKAVSDVADDMASNVEKVESDADDKIGEFIKTLNENTCKKCKNYKKCWNE